MEITEQQFMRFEKVRESGRTNMFMTGTVAVLSNLSEEQGVEIMDNYEELAWKYRRDA